MAENSAQSRHRQCAGVQMEFACGLIVGVLLARFGRHVVTLLGIDSDKKDGLLFGEQGELAGNEDWIAEPGRQAILGGTPKLLSLGGWLAKDTDIQR